jgi:hypothetical protein
MAEAVQDFRAVVDGVDRRRLGVDTDDPEFSQHRGEPVGTIVPGEPDVNAVEPAARCRHPHAGNYDRLVNAS